VCVFKNSWKRGKEHTVPSCMVRAIGLWIKSGWLFPSGSSSMNCAIMTPGTLDFIHIHIYTEQNYKGNTFVFAPIFHELNS